MLKSLGDINKLLYFKILRHKSRLVEHNLRFVHFTLFVLGNFCYLRFLEDSKILITVVGVAIQSLLLPQSIFLVLFHYKVPDVMSTVTKYSVILENCFVNKIKDHQLRSEKFFERQHSPFTAAF